MPIVDAKSVCDKFLKQFPTFKANDKNEESVRIVLSSIKKIMENKNADNLNLALEVHKLTNTVRQNGMYEFYEKKIEYEQVVYRENLANFFHEILIDQDNPANLAEVLSVATEETLQELIEIRPEDYSKDAATEELPLVNAQSIRGEFLKQFPEFKVNYKNVESVRIVLELLEKIMEDRIAPNSGLAVRVFILMGTFLHIHNQYTFHGGGIGHGQIVYRENLANFFYKILIDQNSPPKLAEVLSVAIKETLQELSEIRPEHYPKEAAIPKPESEQAQIETLIGSMGSTHM